MRDFGWELRASILDDLGLVEAIEWHAEMLQARTGIICERNRFFENIRFSEATSFLRSLQDQGSPR
jgi:signal transduction histidine kinase